jgi:hypothetical protein
MTDIENLETLAKAATPGPWTVCKHLESVEADLACTCGYRGVVFGPDHDAPMAICQPGHDPDPVGEEGLGPQNYARAQQIANGQWIAAANPAAILELCAEVRRLRESIRLQANAARAGMDAAKRTSTIQFQLAEQARAASSPDVLESERAMNAMLTEENERMRTLLDHRPALNAGLVEAYMTWTAQVYASDHAAFSGETKQ